MAWVEVCFYLFFFFKSFNSFILIFTLDVDPNVLFQAFFGGDGGFPFAFQSGGGRGGARGGAPGGFSFSFGR